MTEQEHFLLCLAEECDEVGQRIMKALRFGLDEVQPGQGLNNAERIVEELHDLIAVARILERRGTLAGVLPSDQDVEAKEHRIRRFMALSRTLTEPSR